VFLMPAGVVPMPADGELQPPAAPAATGRQPPRLAAASYAEAFLAEHKQLAARNGHRQLAGVTDGT
jgi:hypothetical protein